MQFFYNGLEFTGDKFEVRKDVLYVDDYPVADFRGGAIEIKGGKGEIHTDMNIVLHDAFRGTIRAKSVVINGDVSTSSIEASQVMIFAKEGNDRLNNVNIQAEKVHIFNQVIQE